MCALAAPAIQLRGVICCTNTTSLRRSQIGNHTPWTQCRRALALSYRPGKGAEKSQTGHGEDRRRRFGQDRDRCRENIEIIPAQLREGEVNRKRRDHAERRDHFRRRDDVVDRVRVGRVQPVTGCGDERDPTVARRITPCNRADAIMTKAGAGRARRRA